MANASKPSPRMPRPAAAARRRVVMPDTDAGELALGPHSVKLTNLNKVFWSDLNLTRRDLLQYYADMSRYLLPHLSNRAMVMKR